MSNIFTDIKNAWTWFTKVFVSHIVSAAPVAITITQFIKTLLANPATQFLESVADSVTGTQIPTNIANTVIAIIPKILAVELGIEGLPPNATPDQILAFENAILAAFNVTGNNSKLYTELASQIYGIIQQTIASGQTNFAGWVVAVEQAYADYQKDLAANAAVVAVAPIAVSGSGSIVNIAQDPNEPAS